MAIPHEKVDQHYGRSDILAMIREGLNREGKSLDMLAVDDLAPVDEFHTRGREATEELVSLGNITAEDSVVDVGCGLGGSPRYLAHRWGCHVTGVDLTEQFITIAKELTRWVGLESRVTFVHGSALQLPFDADSFDVAWTEHAQMNIADKDQFYSEIARVLKPGGRLLFHDVFAGAGAGPFPVPWAENASISSLVTEDAARLSMRNAGLRIQAWENRRERSIAFFENVQSRLQSNGFPPIGIHLLMGENAAEKLQNYLVGLSRGNFSVAMGRCQLPADGEAGDINDA